ncbi:hypothetical protein FHU28_005276 [Micromonospora echinospora]|uniref:Uncharacterized protein n=1 Tax=Micromonospora echinospora TaxID=1877 RepID=A0ABR6MJI0_MICEC|nr:hypothetical protein [Micromonospora echinospora]MBB5115437.1 hypothetical protein [Micromonospora echinospora]
MTEVNKRDPSYQSVPIDRWVTLTLGAAGGIAINLASDRIGFPALASALVAAGALMAARWIRQRAPRTRLAKLAQYGSLVLALLLAIIVLVDSRAATYLLIVAVGLVMLAVLMTSDPLSATFVVLGVGFVGAGVAVAGYGASVIQRSVALGLGALSIGLLGVVAGLAIGGLATKCTSALLGASSFAIAGIGIFLLANGYWGFSLAALDAGLVGLLAANAMLWYSEWLDSGELDDEEEFVSVLDTLPLDLAVVFAIFAVPLAGIFSALLVGIGVAHAPGSPEIGWPLISIGVFQMALLICAPLRPAWTGVTLLMGSVVSLFGAVIAFSARRTVLTVSLVALGVALAGIGAKMIMVMQWLKRVVAWLLSPSSRP